MISKEIENNKFDFSHPPGEFKSQKDKNAYYSKLNYLDVSKTTDELIQLITKRKVERGIRIYRITKGIEQNTPPITKEMLKDAAKILNYTSDQLLDILLIKPDQKTKHRIQYGLLLAEKKNNIVTMKERAVKKAAHVLGLQSNHLLKILYNDINREIEPDNLNNSEKEPEEKVIKKHKRTDFPLNILVYFLVENIKQKEEVESHHYRMIDGFISEQGIMDARDESSISKRYWRYTPKKYETIYNLFRDIYYNSLSLNLDQILKQDSRYSAIDGPKDEGDMIFPHWVHFLA